MEAIHELSLDRWHGPFAAETQADALAALENGQVLVFPKLVFNVQPAELPFLSEGALDGTRKNISFDPATGTCHGTTLQGADLARLAAMLNRFGTQAETLLRNLLPRYAPALERARTSFRPAEISGRQYAPRKDDRRLHVDAFPTRPMHTRRILRMFTNAAVDGTSREWRVGEPFPDFAGKFLPRVRGALPGEGWILAQLGLTKGRRSAYDHIMLRLHDAAKLDDDYQARGPSLPLAFPPGTSWLCFSDQVLHAAMAGHHALEQTFHLPVEQMAMPEQAPLRVLERLSGRRLA
jgi:hypothetical protein